MTELETDYLILAAARWHGLRRHAAETKLHGDCRPPRQTRRTLECCYPFVCLHQPSNIFGVASRELSRFEKDKVGLKGFMTRFGRRSQFLF